MSPVHSLHDCEDGTMTACSFSNLTNTVRISRPEKQISVLSDDGENSVGYDPRRNGHRPSPGSHGSGNRQSSHNSSHISQPDGKNGELNLHESDSEASRAVIIGRGVFVVFILVVAGVFGFMAYYVLNVAEENLAAKQYVSFTSGALQSVRDLAENKLVHGTQIMAKHVGWTYPNAGEDWPFVWVPSYWDIMEDVLPTSVWSGVNLAPIVQPEQVAAFEEFAYGKFDENFGENTTMGGTSHFGRGIWVQDPLRVNTSDHRYHDTTGVPLYEGSPYNYLAPKIQDGLVHTPYTMMNVHGFELQGLSLDAVMNCSIARKENATRDGLLGADDAPRVTSQPQGCDDSEGVACAPNPKQFRCSALSGMLPPKNIKEEHGIAGFIATPIYPANDPYELVGFIFGIVYWVEVMIDIFPMHTVGIDCVFEDPDYQYTYTIRNNTSTLICEGDCHDETYNSYRMSTKIVDSNLLSEGSVVYTMTCYPNDEFFQAYHTNNPITASIGAILIIMLTSVLFFLYDYFVRQEFSAKKDLFEAKRKFVRFVSHEVRTPMNSVCMGLNVLQEEAAIALGYETPDGIRKTKTTDGIQNQPHLGRQQIEHWFDLANEISVNAQASVEVLDDFLNYDKIASGELSLEYTIVPAWNLIEDTVAEFKLPMTKKNITLHFMLPTANDFQKTVAENRKKERNNSIMSQGSSERWSLRSGIDGSDRTRPLDNRGHESTKNLDDLEAGCGGTDDWYSQVQNMKLIGDSIRITQVIRNLVSNAIKFSREGGDIRISTKFQAVEKVKKPKTFELKSEETLTCSQTGDLVFTITDTGAGLTQSQLKNLFKAGVQFDVNNLQAGKGSGLGLYISKGIIEQHGGKLSANSKGLGSGTTFTVALPIFNVPEKVWYTQQLMRKNSRRSTRFSIDSSLKTAKTAACSVTVLGGDDEGRLNIEEKENTDGKHSEDEVLSEDESLSELKILLVDDSKSNRKLLDRLLTMRGHKCEHAEDGHIGVEMTLRAEGFAQPYDIVLMDYEMPTLNGPAAVKEIRDYGCDVFIVGVTGNIMAEDVKYFKDCGANLVLPKPFKVKEFQALIQENLEHDSRGRIVEKIPGGLEFITLGLSQRCDGNMSCSSTLGWNESSSHFDTSLKSISSVLDREESGKVSFSLPPTETQ